MILTPLDANNPQGFTRCQYEIEKNLYGYPQIVFFELMKMGPYI